MLRPGGLFIGYDLADTGVARFTHRVDGSEHRLISPADFETELGEHGVAAFGVRTSVAGAAFRFTAQASS